MKIEETFATVLLHRSFSIDSRFERAPRGGSAHFSIQRCMLLDSSTRSLRYLHKSWCNCRERWLAGITEIRNDEAREDWNAGERNWVMLGSWPLPVSTFFHVYSQGDDKNNCSAKTRVRIEYRGNSLPSAVIVLIGIQRSQAIERKRVLLKVFSSESNDYGKSHAGAKVNLWCTGKDTCAENIITLQRSNICINLWDDLKFV